MKFSCTSLHKLTLPDVEKPSMLTQFNRWIGGGAVVPDGGQKSPNAIQSLGKSLELSLMPLATSFQLGGIFFNITHEKWCSTF